MSNVPEDKPEEWAKLEKSLSNAAALVVKAIQTIEASTNSAVPCGLKDVRDHRSEVEQSIRRGFKLTDKKFRA